MRHTRLLHSLITLTLLASSVLAATVHSAKMTIVPQQPYVGEDFEFRLEVVSSAGCELEIAELSGVPAGENLMVGRFAARDVREETGSDGEKLAVTTFTAPARALKAFAFKPNSAVRLKLTERISQGFFSSWNTTFRASRVTWDDFMVRELPQDGRPDDFSGAIGRYEMKLEATPNEVMPNDIVKLKLDLTGHGHLGDAVPVMPKLDESLFKSYPPTVTKNADGSLSVTQSVIPLSTNAIAIGEASFSFFDASNGVYTNYTTRPLMLSFIPERKSEAPAVREVVVDTGTRAKAETGVDVTKYLNLVRGGKSFQLEVDTAMRIAPSLSAKKIITLSAGTSVTPLEAYRGFLRVRANDRIGWISVPK